MTFYRRRSILRDNDAAKLGASHVERDSTLFVVLGRQILDFNRRGWIAS
jgi:hypothetical protein